MNPQDTRKGSQFVLSYELLALLRWLADHDADKLKKIIGKALTSGFQGELNQLNQTDETVLVDEMHHSITDFLSLLESLLIETVRENLQQKAKYQNLMPAVDQIDSTICDDNTVRFSLEKATEVIENNPTANPKEMLFKELLKRWKPIDKNLKN
jgi:hypothetical protein